VDGDVVEAVSALSAILEPSVPDVETTGPEVSHTNVYPWAAVCLVGGGGGGGGEAGAGRRKHNLYIIRQVERLWFVTF